MSQTEEQDIVTAQIALEVEEACQNGSIQAKIDVENDKEAAVELGITWASLQASNAQRRNQYYLAKEDEEDEGEDKDSDSEAAISSDSGLADFDSSDDDDEEAKDHIIE